MQMTVAVFDLWLADLRDHGGRGLPSGIRRDGDASSEDSARAIPVDDVALVEQIRAGNQEAFGELFDRYYIPLCVFANRSVYDMEAAREIVSEVFYRLWLRREHWVPVQGIAAYCFGAVRNRVQNYTRDQRTHTQWAQRVAVFSGQPLVGTQPILPEAFVELQDRTERLWQAVASLPDRQQLVITLRWQQGMSFEEIASIAGISRGAAQMLADRALKALRLRLASLAE